MRRERRKRPWLLPALALLTVAAALGAILLGLGSGDSEETKQARPMPKPVASSSMVRLTPEEVRSRTGEYMALNLWAETVHRTAEHDPANFHQALFSEPDMDCVNEHRELLKTTPSRQRTA